MKTTNQAGPPLSHPTPSDIYAFAIGKMPIEWAERTAAHLEACPQCSQQVAEWDRGSDSLVSQLVGLRLEAPQPDAPLSEALATAKAAARESIGSGSAAEDDSEATSAPTPIRVREYELLAKLGEGAMGAVYRARHTRLDRIVAIKLLSAHRLGSSDAIARFAREMRAVGRLEHPHLIRASDAGEAAGVHFLVMEFVRGCDLAKLVKRHGPLAIADACELVRQAAVGLAYAHENGLVHRDIKPSNLMLSESGQVKILDLGLALLLEESVAEGEELTTTGHVMGTVDYMAPEQASHSHQVDRRADIYSLGATLYKLLSGQAPLASDKHNTTLKKVMALAAESPRPIRELRSDVPSELADFIARMLAKSPDDRPDTGLEVAAALASWATGHRVELLAAAGGQAASSPSSADVVSSTTRDTSPILSSPTTAIPSEYGAPPQGVEHAAAALTSTARDRRRIRNLSIGVAGAFLFAACGVWVLIKNKEGTVVGRHAIPEGGSATVSSDNTDSAAATARVATRPAASGLNNYSGRANPLGPYALVSQPVALPGVKAWTIETRAPRGPVYELEYSPDGRWLAVASDSSVRIYDGATGELSRVLLGHRGGPFSIAWNADSKRLASGGCDAVHIWDVTSAKTIDSIPLNRTDLRSIDWSRDGTKIAVGSAIESVKDGQLIVFSFPDKKILFERPIRTCYVAFSPNGQSLAFTDDAYNRVTKIVNATTGEERTAINRVGPIAWSLTDDRLMVKAGLYDSEYGELLTTLALEDGRSPSWLSDVKWSPDGKLMATAEVPERLIAIWKDGESKPLLTLSLTVGLQIAWSSDSGRLAVGAENGWLQVWDISVTPPKRQLSLEGHGGSRQVPAAAVSWNHRSDTLASAPHGNVYVGAETIVRVWPLTGTAATRSFKTAAINGDAPAWSANDSQITVCGGYQEGIRIHSVADGAVTLTLLDPDKAKAVASAVNWSPDNKLVAAFSQKKILFWQTSGALAGEPLTPDSSDAEWYTLAWSPDSKYLAAGRKGESPAATVFDVTSRKLVATGMPAQRLAWNKDGQRLALGSSSSIAIWRPFTGESLKQPRRVAALCWRSDADLVLALVWDPSTRSLVLEHLKGDDLQSLKRIADLPGDLGQHAGQFSPDGKWLATGYGNTIWLVSTADGRPRGTLVALDQGRNLVISPEGHFREMLGASKDLVYVAMTESGQQLYSPDEFVTQFGWKNDPSQVHLLGAPAQKSDHEAAKWAMRIGGKLTIELNGDAINVRSQEELPEGAYHLTGLNLAGRPVRDHDLARLNGLNHLESLDLKETGVTDAGLKHLEGLPALTHLTLYKTKITDAAFDSLSKMQALRRLSISETKTTTFGWQRLKELPKLSELHVAMMPFADSDLADLSAAQPELETLNLWGTAVTDAGMPHLAQLHRLRLLHLNFTKVTGRGLASLAALEHLQSLQLSSQMAFADEAARHLSHAPALESLQLQNTGLTDAGLMFLARIKSLRELKLGQTKITNAGLPDLAGLPQLRLLQLQYPPISDEGAAFLSQLRELTSLELGEVQSDKGLESLSRLQQLEELHFSGVKLTDAGLAHLARLPNLRLLDCKDRSFTEAGILALAETKNLKTLILRGSQKTPAAIERLRKALPQTEIQVKEDQ